MGKLNIRVLVVDDEQQIRRLLRTSLTAHGYEVFEALSAEEAIMKAAQDRVELILLDLGLTDADGTEVIRRIREWSKVPIVVLSVRGEEKEKIQALDLGADDYVTKPFGMGELLARMRAALRHQLQTDGYSSVFRASGLKVDLSSRQVFANDKEIKLSPKEYDLLRVLVLHAGKVLTHHQLLHQIWGPEYIDETQYLRVYIGQLRQKIEPNPSQPTYLLTESGVGYRLRSPD